MRVKERKDSRKIMSLSDDQNLMMMTKKSEKREKQEKLQHDSEIDEIATWTSPLLFFSGCSFVIALSLPSCESRSGNKLDTSENGRTVQRTEFGKASKKAKYTLEKRETVRRLSSHWLLQSISFPLPLWLCPFVMSPSHSSILDETFLPASCQGETFSKQAASTWWQGPNSKRRTQWWQPTKTIDPSL